MARGRTQRLDIPSELSRQEVKPCHQRKPEDDSKETQSAKHLANDIKAILLHKLDSKKLEISVVALQDSGTLAKVIERLLEMSSADKKDVQVHQKHIPQAKKRIHKPHPARHSVRKKIHRPTSHKAKSDHIDRLSDSISQISISPDNGKASCSPLLSFDLKEASRTATLTSNSSVETVCPDGHRLTPNYLNGLRRRRALARRTKPSHDISKHATFDKKLPLDLPHKNIFKRWLEGIYNKNMGSVNGDGRQHYLQRAHIPIDYLSNVPISEQIQTFINPKEIEAYRRSGMSLLNMDVFDQTSQTIDPSKDLSSPSFVENVHDIWYEDLSPPPDAVSVFVYWWGYEVYLPKDILDKMRKKGSVTTSLLSIIASITATVPVIQPCIKLLSAFISMESSASDLLHSPQGTVLTATWLLPFLVIPRPWY